MDQLNNIIELSPKSLKALAEVVKEGHFHSLTSQVLISLVPIIGVLLGTFLFFSLFYFYHKQKVLLIEKGLFKPIRINWSLALVLTGMALMMTGVSITTVFLINKKTGLELLGGLVPLGVGIALFSSYFIIRKNSN